MSTSIVTDPTLLQSINGELKDPGRPWDLSWSGSSVQLNSKSELTIQEQQMKYSTVCNMLAAVYAKQATRQLGGSEALVWGGLDLVDFVPPLVSARCHVSTWSSSSLLTRSSLSTACHCHCHCICHHQCLFCVLGVIIKSIDHLGHYVPIVAKSCFDHIFKMQLEYIRTLSMQFTSSSSFARLSW